MHITIKNYQSLPLSTFLLIALIAVILWQPAVAQPSSLPSCTEAIADTDDDGVDAAMDIDKDGDGLIELCSLEGLDAIRHQLDGMGYLANSTATLITTGCPEDGCRGYELVRSLDFDEADSYDSGRINTAWTTGEGWLPLGTSRQPFGAVFEGNGHTLSNLMIGRPTGRRVGLFGDTRTDARIANIGLFNVDIIGLLSVGGLVGNNGGSITNSYATGEVTGSTRSGSIGGLVGWNTRGTITNSYATVDVTGDNQVGGLVGRNGDSRMSDSGMGIGSITNSYATGAVNGELNAGGLVGFNSVGSITNSYATGAVTGSGTRSASIGGLVGRNSSSGSITNSYATGEVDGDERVGDLVGSNEGGSPTNSSGLSIMELQAPTMATGIYEQWDTANWDFGNQSQFPALKYTSGADGNNPTCGNAGQPSCDQLLTDQFPSFLNSLAVLNGLLLPEFDPQRLVYTAAVGETVNSITLQAMATDSVITIRGDGIDEQATTDTISQDVPLARDSDTLITIEVSDLRTESGHIYQLTVERIILPACTQDLADTDDDGVPAIIDIDKDGDGLIELCSLEGLDAIRHQLDGNGYRADSGADIITVGCPEGSCRGYELVRSLDFDDTNSYDSGNINTVWTTDAGWLPIGNRAQQFNAVFEGNGHTISNLMIGRSATGVIGLFGATGTNSSMANVGLLNVDNTGNDSVGSLVGRNEGGSITNSYAMGDVDGRNRVGGLVGFNGGSITNSYATGAVPGNGDEVGGLVGRNEGGSITNSYATSNVVGIRFNIGGLVGRNESGSITNSYAMGEVTGQTNVGGLVGWNRANITNSYATSDVNGQLGTLVGRNEGSLTESQHLSIQELQSPTTDIYAQWNTADWDFGTETQAPILRYARGSDPENPACGVAGQPSCGSLLADQLNLLDSLTVSNGLLTPEFNPQTSNYIVLVDGTVDSITLQATAADKSITLRSDRLDEQVAEDSINQNIPITAGGGTTITIIVSTPDGRRTANYMLTVESTNLSACIRDLADIDDDSVPAVTDIDKDNDGLIEICDLEGLNAIRYQLDGRGYRANSIGTLITTGCPVTGCDGYELVQSLDFEEADSYDSGRINTAWTARTGWLPIGTFNAVFEGNGHTISNLMIDRSADNIGLFAETDTNSRMTNIGLLDVVIRGNNRVGGLVGLNDGGSIANSYAVGSVTGRASAIGGLVGLNGGSIANSYAVGNVTGSGQDSVGGLVGENGGSVTNSYATGDVAGQNDVGGLVGENGSPGSITNSYALGDVTGGNRSGSLVGENSGTIMNSYAAGDVNGQGNASVLSGSNPSGSITGSSHQSIAQLQLPTTTTNIYSEWNTADWDFGNTTQFPALKYTRGSDADNPACGVAEQPSCGSLLSNQLPSLLDNLTISDGRLVPDFNQQRFDYDVVVGEIADSITLDATATDKSITIRSDDLGEQVANDSINQNIPITAGGVTMIMIEVSAPGERSAGNYRLIVGPLNNDPSLSDLTLMRTNGRSIRLTETFAPEMTAYTARVANAIAQVRVMPTTTHPGATITVNSNTMVSDDGDIALTEGRVTTITIVVTAQNGVATRNYTIAVTRPLSDDAQLRNLVLTQTDGMEINIGTFESEVDRYIARVDSRVDQVRVMPTANHPGATITVNNIPVASGGQSGNIALTEGGGTIIRIRVTAQNERDMTTYTIFMNRLSGDANLSDLELTQTDGTPIRLTENFAPTTTTYTVTVANAIVQVIPTANHPDATITVNDIPVARGDQSGNILLTAGEVTTITIVVTAQDRSVTRNYAIAVTRLSNDASLSDLVLTQLDGTPIQLDEAFAPTTTTYTVSVAHVIDRVRVMPTVNHPSATITVGSNTVVSDDGDIDLTEGGVTTITIVVTAQDGMTTETYTVAVSRALSSDASLSGLVLTQLDGTPIQLDQTFAPTTTTYTVSVSARQVRVTPTATHPEATIIVDSNTVVSDDGDIDLIEGGVTTITIVVTAQDRETTETYTVAASRALSSDASLSGLVLTQLDGTLIQLDQTFAPTTTTYTVSVSARQVRVTPTATHPEATIIMDRMTVVSDTTSGNIMLAAGSVTTITIVVTAQDGQTMETYTVAVSRALSSDASLSDLELVDNQGRTTNIFQESTTYTVTVSNTLAQVRVKPTATEDNQATIVVSADNFVTETVVSGAETTAFVPLEEIGARTIINIVVTAPDGNTEITYRITVVRVTGFALWRDFPGGARAVCDDADIDNDDDGLIEICYLEDVDAIRYRLDGSGLQRSSDATLVTTGCGGGDDNDTCNGYELVRDLDFNDSGSYRDASANRSNWTTGAGWPYIGSETDGRTIFSGILEGNGHTIANLFVNASPGNQRHSSFIQGINGTVRNLGLRDIDVTITGGNERGAIFIYEVRATGRIINCYITGVSNYNGTNQFSGFVRDHEGKILNSYVDIEFNGSMHGLLVGENRGANTEVSNSYVIGNAMNARNTRSFMHTNKGSIENAYYAVKTSGGSAALLISNQGSISSSYYDNEKWGGTMRIVETTNSDGSDENSGGYSTMDLQMPTAANLDDMDSPYYQWSEDNWSFGTSEQYPLLKYGSGDDQANPACGNSQQPRCGTLLRGQESGQELSPDATLAALVLTDTSGEVTLTPVFASAMTNYTASVTETVDEVQVTPIATEGMVATIMIGNETVESGDSFDISLGAAGTNTDIEIVVTAPNGTTTNSYTVTVRRELSDDATLSFLTLTDRLSETPVTGDINSFSPDKLQYSARVLHTVSMVTVTVSATNGNAEIRVDSDEVESDTGFDVALGNPGSDTVIEIEVTAQDGMTTNTYTITVNRAETPALNDATLFDLALRLTDTDDTRIELSPAFASPRTSYNAGVADTVDTIAVTPTATNNNATITVTVDETEVETVVSGNASRPIDLTEGEGATTTITIVVTAQDGNTMRKYTIAVTRALPGIRVRVKVFLEGPLR